ncbi:unnamed protein product, partial [Effrenium voratum]
RPSSWQRIPSSRCLRVTQDILPRETASLLRTRDILGMCQRLKVGELPVNARSTATFTAAILRDGMVLDCFPVERKRRLLKAYASHLRSGPGFERGIFARSILTSAHIAVAARKDALLRGEVLCEGNANMLVSHQFYWKQDLYTADDVVLAQGVPVSLVCGLRVDDRMAAVVVPLELLSMSATFSTWRQRRHCASLLGGSGAATSSRSSLGDTGKDSVQQSAAVWKKPRLLFQR